MMPWCEDFDLIRYETLFSVQSRWALGVGYFSLDGKVRVMYTEPGILIFGLEVELHLDLIPLTLQK